VKSIHAYFAQKCLYKLLHNLSQIWMFLWGIDGQIWAVFCGYLFNYEQLRPFHVGGIATVNIANDEEANHGV